MLTKDLQNYWNKKSKRLKEQNSQAGMTIKNLIVIRSSWKSSKLMLWESLQTLKKKIKRLLLQMKTLFSIIIQRTLTNYFKIQTQISLTKKNTWNSNRRLTIQKLLKYMIKLKKSKDTCWIKTNLNLKFSSTMHSILIFHSQAALTSISKILS